MDDGPNARPTRRIELLDMLRGGALLAMAVYHFTWDLEFFGYLPRGTAEEGGWRLFARGIATSFLLLVGIGLVLAHGRAIRWRSFGQRLAQVVAGAGAITAATYIMTPQGFVFFGILHQIAVGSIIGLLVLRLPFALTLAIGVGFVVLPNLVSTDATNPIWLAWIGLAVRPPLSNDFVPIFPWTGPIIIGIGVAQAALRLGVFERLADWNDRLRPARPLAFIGRHSLLFYLVHQPVLIAVVAAWAAVFPPDQTAAFAQSCRLTCEADRDAAYCVRYCGCVQGDLESKDLLTALLEGRLSTTEQSTVRAAVAACSFSAEP